MASSIRDQFFHNPNVNPFDGQILTKTDPKYRALVTLLGEPSRLLSRSSPSLYHPTSTPLLYRSKSEETPKKVSFSQCPLFLSNPVFYPIPVVIQPKPKIKIQPARLFSSFLRVVKDKWFVDEWEALQEMIRYSPRLIGINRKTGLEWLRLAQIRNHDNFDSDTFSWYEERMADFSFDLSLTQDTMQYMISVTQTNSLTYLVISGDSSGRNLLEGWDFWTHRFSQLGLWLISETGTGVKLILNSPALILSHQSIGDLFLQTDPIKMENEDMVQFFFYFRIGSTISLRQIIIRICHSTPI